ncbi:MAG: hypothetical protein NTW86_05850 [Candidatus Sumerlaeota bacterium]|nr:hypothetical protein [Candidatus Sumerlaeota bacterium]
MIGMIGTMIGLYCITRCLSFITRAGDRNEHIIVRVMAVVTILMCILGVLSFFSSGFPAPTP